MKRIAAALRNDVRIQVRNGFYAAAAFVAVCGMVGLAYLRGLLSPGMLAIVLPPFLLSNLLMGNFYFLAGQVLLERGEGTLAAVVVSPLRDAEYLMSKVATLSLLGLLGTLALVLGGYGRGFDPLLLAGGVLLAAPVYVLFGFLSVARHTSLNDYLLPSMGWVAFLSVPYAQYFVASDQAWRAAFWLHPLQPGLVLLRGAFGDAVGAAELAYVALYGGAAIAVAFRRSLKTFRAFVVAAEGVT